MPENKVLRLNAIAKAQGLVGTARISLKALCETILGYTLDKAASCRTSSWDFGPVAQRKRKEMIDYAARDAWASLLIGMKLQDPVAFQNNSPISDSGSELSSSPISPNVANPEHRVTVHLDVFHAMARITERMPSKHPLLYPFCLELSRAFFILDAEDKRNIEEHLSTKGMSFERKWIINPDWIKCRVKARIPPPAILKSRLLLVKNKYSNAAVSNSEDGPLLNNIVLKEFDNLMVHVSKGCLSDPEDFNLYVKKRKDQDGLQLYRCLRGTNAVELWHQFIEMKFSSWNAGPDFAQAAMNVLLNRRNIRASVRNRPNFTDFGHYEHNLIDEINDLYFYLFGQRRYAHWNSRKETKALREYQTNDRFK